MVEDKLIELLMSQLHCYLIFGVLSVIYILKTIRPINDFLFSEKWKWLVGPINLALSFFGIFILKLTEVQGVGPKIMVALVISAFSTFAYELVFKHLEMFLRNRFQNGLTPPPT